jgi:NAD+ kinase
MIKIAIFANSINEDFNPYLESIFALLPAEEAKKVIFKPFYESLPENIRKLLTDPDFFSSPKDLDNNIDVLLSIGGDGTFLESVTYVQDSGIPIAGINSGRLGFLANISRNEIEPAIKKILSRTCSFEERELIQLNSPKELFGDCNYALNELTVSKKDSSSMITIHTYLNGQFLNTYWADGLIIATPTGSTAYSLSLGGPIVVPDAKNFIITPIAPHNLTVRPMVVPNNQELMLKIEGRDENYLLSLDRRYESIQPGIEIKINKAKFKIKVIKHDERTFFSTLREKFMWGLDKRN